MTEFQGQSAVITGAASGIGRALAHKAVTEGMNVFLADRDEAGLEKVKEELIRPGQTILCQETDVSKAGDLKKLAARAHQELGDINLLFNNAGVCPIGMTWDMATEDWEWVFSVNVMGVIHGQKAFLPLMMAQEGPARIINTGSIAGLFSNPGGSAYAVSKHAVVALSEGLFMDLQVAQSPVKVSVMCPGFVKTNLGAGIGEPQKKETPDSVKQGREALQRTLEQGISPEELASRVFAGIKADQFWIFTQPEMMAGFDLRCASIANGTNPSFVPMLD